MSKPGIIICTRADSQRLPNKPFRKINGVPVIEHLIARLQKTKIPIYIAYPAGQHSQYAYLGKLDNVILHKSNLYGDPLGRMYECAKANGVETIIRVSHDKILVDDTDVADAMFDFVTYGHEYLYGTTFTPGTGFEIISFKALELAASKFKNVEYIGYSVRSVTDKIWNFRARHQRINARFLIDYEDDLKLFEVLFSKLGNNATLNQCVKYLIDNPEIKEINKQPILSIYTCAYNAEKYLETAMDSVAALTGFKGFEYILIDDHSKDSTCEIMAKFALKHPNVSWHRNEQNLGLASSSNIALKKAKGRYIMRLDADDFFIKPNAIKEMLFKIQDEDIEAVYPDNYFGDYNKIQKGNENHHAAGTLFDKAALTHIKFTDGLMGHDSLDLYLRAKDQLKIGYLDKAVFFYRQHSESLTKNNLKERDLIKEGLQKNPFLKQKSWEYNPFAAEDFVLDKHDLETEVGLELDQ